MLKTGSHVTGLVLHDVDADQREFSAFFCIFDVPVETFAACGRWGWQKQQVEVELVPGQAHIAGEVAVPHVVATRVERPRTASPHSHRRIFG